MYIAIVIDYFAEEDVYENGCIGNGFSKGNDFPFSGVKPFESCKDLLEYLKANTYGTCSFGFQEPYEENPSEKIVRISFYEDIKGNAVYENDSIWEEWKKGKARLWLCDITISVRKVEFMNFENELEEAGFEAI